MVMNHQAENVTRLEPVSEHPQGGDWSVVYNVTLNRG